MDISIQYYTSSGKGSMIIHLDKLLYPKPWKNYKGRLLKENSLNKIKKIFKFIKINSDQKTWESIREYIESHPIRRYKKYLEIWEGLA